MPHDQVYDALIAAVTQIQQQSQRDLPPLHDSTRLIGDVPGCDSLVIVEVSIILTEILEPILQGREIPDCILQGAGKNARPTLKEIAGSVEGFINQGKASRRGTAKKANGQSEVKLATTNGAHLNATNGHSEKASKALLPALKSASPKVSHPTSSPSQDIRNRDQNENPSGDNA